MTTEALALRFVDYDDIIKRPRFHADYLEKKRNLLIDLLREDFSLPKSEAIPINDRIRALARLSFACLDFMAKNNIAIPPSHLPIIELQSYYIQAVVNQFSSLHYLLDNCKHKLGILGDPNGDKKLLLALKLIEPFIEQLDCPSSLILILQKIFPRAIVYASGGLCGDLECDFILKDVCSVS